MPVLCVLKILDKTSLNIRRIIHGAGDAKFHTRSILYMQCIDYIKTTDKNTVSTSRAKMWELALSKWPPDFAIPIIYSKVMLYSVQDISWWYTISWTWIRCVWLLVKTLLEGRKKYWDHDVQLHTIVLNYGNCTSMDHLHGCSHNINLISQL